jgi:hypothetical protein
MGRTYEDTKAMIGKARHAFTILKPVWRSRHCPHERSSLYSSIAPFTWTELLMGVNSTYMQNLLSGVNLSM